MTQEQDAVREVAGLLQGMSYKNHSSALISHPLHSRQAPLLELNIADGKHLVDENNIRVNVNCYRETQPRVHAGRVEANRKIDSILDARELNDFTQMGPDILSR